MAPGLTENVIAAFDRAAPIYDQTGVAFFTPLGERLVAGAGLAPGDRVLDVGCGRGACTFPAAWAVGPGGQIVGIDLAPAMARATAHRASVLGLTNVDIVQADAAEPGFPPRSFDAVVMGFVAFLLADPAATLRCYRQLLRSGGRLAMSTYGVHDPLLHAIIDALEPFLDRPPPLLPGRDGPAFESADGLTRLVGAAGFASVRVEDSYGELEFADCDQCWAWLWSGAVRLLMERIPHRWLAAARQAADDQMERLRDPAARLTVQWHVRFTYATRP
jgi:SAM-dependent methyltransferase